MKLGPVFAVVTAAGQSRRMGGTDKLTLPVSGRPLLAHTVKAFLDWPKLQAVAVSVSPGREAELHDTIARCCSGCQKLHVLAGGQERQDSIRLALEFLQKRYHPGPNDPVLIHDGARPFVDQRLFEALLQALPTCDGVLPATPVRDTVKRVSGANVLHTEDRETLRMVQTPQVFLFPSILEFHRRAQREEFLGTDDASLVEHFGGQVTWIPGPAHNLKVTVPEDIALLSELARRAK
jgi:2-C-methyl-D-erythritol 4-phosphate cytidylyltransferase